MVVVGEPVAEWAHPARGVSPESRWVSLGLGPRGKGLTEVMGLGAGFAGYGRGEGADGWDQRGACHVHAG